MLGGGGRGFEPGFDGIGVEGGEFGGGAGGVEVPLGFVGAEEGFEDDGGAVGEAEEFSAAIGGGDAFEAARFAAGVGFLEGVVKSLGGAFSFGGGVPVKPFVAVGEWWACVEVELDGEGGVVAAEFGGEPAHGGSVAGGLVEVDEDAGDASAVEDLVEFFADAAVEGPFVDSSDAECAAIAGGGGGPT